MRISGENDCEVIPESRLRLGILTRISHILRSGSFVIRFQSVNYVKRNLFVANPVAIK
jgi:hypothetical protein